MDAYKRCEWCRRDNGGTGYSFRMICAVAALTGVVAALVFLWYPVR